jgi:hypothetical protein
VYVSILSPIGHASSLDLSALPLWRLELREMVVPATALKVKGLALGVAFPAATGTSAFVSIVCLNCKIPGEDLQLIAAEGLPKVDRVGNKEHLRDALKVLVNSLPIKEMEEVGAKSARLVDTYYEILEAIWGPPPRAQVTGELDGWRWAIGAERFAHWDAKAPAVSNVSALNAAPAVRVVDVNAPPPTAPMTMGPPPSAVKPVSTVIASDDELGPMDPLGPAPGTETKGRKKK